MLRDDESAHMPVPAVRCLSCEFAWNSAAMAEGLKLLGSCPKCGGDLEFRPEAAEAGPRDAAPSVDREGRLAPHLVLGIPRR
jgi:hypothetical protein